MATPNGKQIFAGATTITGLSDAGKIGTTVINTAGTYDLTTEDFFSYRWQRQGGHGSDSSGQNWEIILITLELSTT
jgi:hypothetical protein